MDMGLEEDTAVAGDGPGPAGMGLAAAGGDGGGPPAAGPWAPEGAASWLLPPARHAAGMPLLAAEAARPQHPATQLPPTHLLMEPHQQRLGLGLGLAAAQRGPGAAAGLAGAAAASGPLAPQQQQQQLVPPGRTWPMPPQQQQPPANHGAAVGQPFVARRRERQGGGGDTDAGPGAGVLPAAASAVAPAAGQQAAQGPLWPGTALRTTASRVLAAAATQPQLRPQLQQGPVGPAAAAAANAAAAPAAAFPQPLHHNPGPRAIPHHDPNPDGDHDLDPDHGPGHGRGGQITAGTAGGAALPPDAPDEALEAAAAMALGSGGGPELGLRHLGTDDLKAVAASLGLDPHRERQCLLVDIGCLLVRRLPHSWHASPFPAQPLAVYGFSLVQWGGELYLYGGRCGSLDMAEQGNRDVLRYSAEGREWVPVEVEVEAEGGEPPPARRWHTAVVHGDEMLVFGGQVWGGTEWEATSSMTAFDFNSRRWSDVEQRGLPPSARFRHCCAVHSGCMYVLPGEAVEGRAQTIYCCSLDTRTWTLKSCTGDAPPSKSIEALTSWGGSLYCLTADDSSEAAQVYRLTLDTPPAVSGLAPAPGRGSGFGGFGAAGSGAGGAGGRGDGRAAAATVGGLGGGAGGGGGRHLEWSRVRTPPGAPVPRARRQFCAVAMEGTWLVQGGVATGEERSVVSDLWAFDLSAHTWAQVQLPDGLAHAARASHAAACLDGSAVIIGGWHPAWPQASFGIRVSKHYLPPTATAAAGHGADAAAGGGAPQAAAAAAGGPLAGRTAGQQEDQDQQAVPNTELAASIAAARGALEGGGFCDCVVVAADGSEFPAHRFILAAQSEVFERMLGTAGMLEGSTGRVVLPEVPPDVVGELLDYLYGGLGGISPDLVTELFTTSDRFQLDGLKAECIMRMRQVLCEGNVVMVAGLAALHGLQGLWEDCVAFAASHGRQAKVYGSRAFEDMWRSNPSVARVFTTQVSARLEQHMAALQQAVGGGGAGAGGLDAMGAGGAAAAKRHRAR